MTTPFKLTITALVIAIVSPAHAQLLKQATADAPVRMSIVSDTDAVQPGTTVTLGALFDMKDDWHIYWSNPGAAGLPTSVTLSADVPGVTFGPLQYPAPVLFMSPGDIISYGYDHQVMLTAEMFVDAGVQAKEINVTAGARWLQCRENCVQRKDEKSFRIPVGSGNKQNAELFKKYMALTPRSTADPAVRVEKRADASGMTVTVSPDGGRIIAEDKLPEFRKLFFFPYGIKGVKMKPLLPTEGDSKAQVGAAEIRVHSKPVQMGYELTGVNPASPPALPGGVLVLQKIEGNNVASPRVLEIR